MNKSPFWSFIEELEDFSAPLADWKNTQHGKHDIDAMRHAFLLSTDQYAKTMRCPAKCDRPCPMRVQYKERCIEAVCGENLSCNHSLSEHDILIYQLSINKLHRVITEAFGFELAPQSLNSKRRYLLGKYIPYAGISYPVYMSYCNFVYGMSGLVKELCTEIPTPFILLATSRRHLNPKAEELLDNHGAVFVSLEDELLIDRQCRVTLNREHSEIFASLLDETANVNSYVFPTPPGTQWEDISIHFQDYQTVSIRIRELELTHSCAEMGMVSSLNKQPLEKWKFLYELAENNGMAGWKNPSQINALKMQKKALCEALKAFFRIDGDPIYWDSQHNAYVCRFKIRPDTSSTKWKGKRLS
jgi:hypothetical protein